MDPAVAQTSPDVDLNPFLTGATNPVDIQIGLDGALYYLQRGGTAGVYRVTPVDLDGLRSIPLHSSFRPGTAWSINLAKTYLETSPLPI